MRVTNKWHKIYLSYPTLALALCLVFTIWMMTVYCDLKNT